MLLTRLLLILVVVFLHYTVYAACGSEICEQYYPHWDCNDFKQIELLTKIEGFISKHSDGKGVVAFDWDGTLYDEHIKNPDDSSEEFSSAAIWRVWGSNNLKLYPYLFPSFKADPDTIEEQSTNIKNHVAYLYGKTFQPSESGSVRMTLEEYARSSLSPRFESGMSLEELRVGISHYLIAYSPKDYAYTKILDIAQRFNNKGFVFVIITGGSGYFVANLFAANNGINKLLNYNLLSNCLPTTENMPNYKANCYIIGNSGKLIKDKQTGQYKFSAVYDDRFVRDIIKPKERVAINGYGKKLALEQLSQRLRLPVVLYAGNHNGDTDAMKEVLSKGNALGIFVQPCLSKSTTFKELLDSTFCTNGMNTCIDIEEPRGK